MIGQAAVSLTRVVSLSAIAAIFAACTTARPTPAPLIPPPPPTPPVFKIPGEPVVLTPAERALGHFLKGQVASNQGDQETALTEFEQAVKNDSESTFLRLCP
jgi:hypothetical protein